MRTTKADPGPPVALRGQPDALRDVSRETALGHRILFVLALILISAAAGVALVRFPTHITIGLVAAAVVAGAILVKPLAGLLLFTCMFLIRPGELYPPLNDLHLERFVGGLTLASMFLAQYRREGRILIDRSRQTTLLTVFLLAVLLSVPLAYWRGGAMTGFSEMLKLVIFYLLIVHLLDTRKRLRIFVGVYSALLVYIALTAFGGYLHGAAFFAQGIDRAVGDTSVANNPNQLGTTMAVTFPLLLLLALHRPLGWRRIPCAFAALLALATMAVTGSRASLLGFLGGVACLCWMSRRRVLLGTLGILLLVAGFAILPDQYQTRYSTITNQALDGSSQGRLSTWLAGVRMVMDRPVFGVGINCFGTAHAANYSSGGRAQLAPATQPLCASAGGAGSGRRDRLLSPLARIPAAQPPHREAALGGGRALAIRGAAPEGPLHRIPDPVDLRHLRAQPDALTHGMSTPRLDCACGGCIKSDPDRVASFERVERLTAPYR